jgi:hypothetical protein
VIEHHHQQDADNEPHDQTEAFSVHLTGFPLGTLALLPGNIVVGLGGVFNAFNMAASLRFTVSASLSWSGFPAMTES